jgi:hypothetical protein
MVKKAIVAIIAKDARDMLRSHGLSIKKVILYGLS